MCAYRSATSYTAYSSSVFWLVGAGSVGWLARHPATAAEETTSCHPTCVDASSSSERVLPCRHVVLSRCRRRPPSSTCQHRCRRRSDWCRLRSGHRTSRWCGRRTRPCCRAWCRAGPVLAAPSCSAGRSYTAAWRCPSAGYALAPGPASWLQLICSCIGNRITNQLLALIATHLATRENWNKSLNYETLSTLLVVVGVARYLKSRCDTYRDTWVTIRYVSRYFIDA